MMLSNRYMMWVLGDLDPFSSDDSAPLAQQLCYLRHDSAPIIAVDWTQKADGLLIADSSGNINMYKADLAGARPLLQHMLNVEYYHSALLVR
jgi:hypothetical protein